MGEVLEKPKILIVATHPVQYQVPWFRYLHTNLTDYEFEVLYLTLPDAEKQGVGFGQAFKWDIPMFEGYHWTNVKNEHLKGKLTLDDFFSIRLSNGKQLIKNINPAAVLLTGWQCLGLIQVLGYCHQLKIPSLIRAESNNLKPRAYYKKLLHRLLLKQYDKFLCIGTANRNFYLDNHVDIADIFNCPYFVDNDFFKRESKVLTNQQQNLTDKWDIPADAFCFCYVGKLNSKKRILDVLKALNIVNDKNVCLLVVGDGELMHKAKAYSKQHSLNVRFTGFLNQSELPQAYSISDCLLLASDYDETWGLVVNEAMACGIPAIVSRRSGCHLDLIKDSISGYSFEFGNPEELALKMQTIKSLDKQDYEKLAARAQINVLENFSIRVATDGLDKALGTLI